MHSGRPDKDADTFAALSERAHEAVNALKAMASETRLRIMCALGNGELPVNRLAAMTGQSPSAVSQHLAKLRAAGLVESRRDGQTIYYRCSPGIAEEIIGALCSYYKPTGR